MIVAGSAAVIEEAEYIPDIILKAFLEDLEGVGAYFGEGKLSAVEAIDTRDQFEDTGECFGGIEIIGHFGVYAMDDGEEFGVERSGLSVGGGSNLLENFMGIHEPAVTFFGSLECFIGEIECTAVVGLQHEEADHHGAIAFGDMSAVSGE